MWKLIIDGNVPGRLFSRAVTRQAIRSYGHYCLKPKVVRLVDNPRQRAEECTEVEWIGHQSIKLVNEQYEPLLTWLLEELYERVRIVDDRLGSDLYIDKKKI